MIIRSFFFTVNNFVLSEMMWKMKKVMIIGGLNDMTKKIYDKLAPICHPQICADSRPIVQGMLKMLEPDIVIVSLSEDSSDPEDIFFLLGVDAFNTPVIAIGSVDIQSRLIKAGYLPKKHIIYMQAPVKLDSIVTCVGDFIREFERKTDEKSKVLNKLKFYERPKEDKKPKEDKRKRILVVDDDPTMLRIMQNMLSKRYIVSVAASSSQAMMAISKVRPDLVLLDYDMPVVDGKMTLEMLRSEENTKDIPVVFLTGMSDQDHVGNVLSLQPEGYILKPPSEAKIFSRLENILGPESD